MAAQKEGPSIENHSNESKPAKILILGDKGVGKTSLIKTCFDDTPPVESGIFKLYLRLTKDGNKKVEIFDLNPGTNCPVRRAGYPKDVNVILLCFSIEKFETLYNVEVFWIYEVRAHFGLNIPIFLVGLKSDVRIVIAPPSGKDRPVKKFVAEGIHKKHRLHGEYMECSMNDRDSVVKVLNRVVLAAMGK